MDEGDGRGRDKEKTGKGKQVGRKNENQKERKASTLGISSNSDLSGEESDMCTLEERDDEEHKVVIKFRDESGLEGVNPVRLTLALKKAVGDCSKDIVDVGQRDRALKLERLGPFQVDRVVVDQGRKQWSKGVITGIPVCVGMEEVKSNLRGGTLLSAQRLQASREGTKVDSQSVLLQFEGEALPKKVTIGYMSYFVRPYVPKPLRCYNCQRFGHIAAMCKETRRCARCGGNHNYGQCGEGVLPNCCKCGGAHNVAYGECAVIEGSSTGAASKRGTEGIICGSS